jgi:hypothetical protein
VSALRGHHLKHLHLFIGYSIIGLWVALVIYCLWDCTPKR